MHRTGLALPLVLSVLALASPQVNTGTLSGLPTCAQDAASEALGSSACPLTDTSCICSSTAFINAITNTITQSCSAADVAAAIEFGRTICGPSLGVAAPSGSSSSATPAGTTPTISPAGTDTDDSYVASTTTIPVTLTSMTSIPGSSATSSITSPVSTSTVPANNATAIMTSMCSSTTWMTSTTGSGAAPAAYTGAAAAGNAKTAQGLMAALMGVAGAVALL